MQRGIWTSEQAHSWYEKVKWQVGLNFVPSNAINPTDMWQKETYDEATIRREVAYASAAGKPFYKTGRAVFRRLFLLTNLLQNADPY